MGAAACQEIIIEGNIGYGVVEVFSEEHPHINTFNLEAAIQASCQGALHASLYLLGEGEENKFSSDYTQPIIDIHKEIVDKLSTVNKHADKSNLQPMIDDLTSRLEAAIRKTYELFD